MICPSCKKKYESGSKFCMYCGAELPVTEQENYVQIRSNRKQTSGERTLISVSHWMLYVSIVLLVLSVICKVVYQESITYGYPTVDSEGYYLVHDSKGNGEQWVRIGIYPLFKVEGMALGLSGKHYKTVSELDSNMNQLREAALEDYQNNINDCILFMIIATIAIFVLGKYVTKICTPQKITLQ